MGRGVLLGEGEVDDELLLELLGAGGFVLEEVVDGRVEAAADFLLLFVEDVAVLGLARLLVLLLRLFEVELHELLLAALARPVLLAAGLPDLPQPLRQVEVQLARPLQLPAHFAHTLLDVGQF